jgi:hypothetical protein
LRRQVATGENANRREIMSRNRLGREIGALLAAKLVLLCALYFAFFNSSHQVAAGAGATSVQILGRTGQ